MTRLPLMTMMTMMATTCRTLAVTTLAATFPTLAAPLPSATDPATAVLRYHDLVRIAPVRGASGELAPQVRITSPLNGGRVARGEGLLAAGSNRGTGLVINLEVFSRDDVPVAVHEATQVPDDPGIRHADLLGQPNPEFPGLYVYIDQPLIKPDGTLIPANTNLAALFNIAGSDDTPGPGVTVWAGWHVLESLPQGAETFTVTAAVVDSEGRIGYDQIGVTLDAQASSGTALTPEPDSYPGDGTLSEAGPKLEIIAPRVPSALAIGDQLALPTAETGTLHFIQLDIIDLAGAGIAVDELGDTVTSPEFGPGSIVDPSQLGVGDNRNFPGLEFSFDVPLQAPNGVLVPAGGNLAPVFNLVGSTIEPLTGAVHVVADWVVGGALILPEGKDFITMTATVHDNQGNAGTAQRRFLVSQVANGQALTPAP